MSVTPKLYAAGVALAAIVSITGCGTPGAPQPPSLHLPEPVADLVATRSGNTVTLHWTMPKRTTDRILLASAIKGKIPTRICRSEGASDPCQPVGDTAFDPSAKAEFQDTLPTPLGSGAIRPLLYYVELRSKPGPTGRSAGLSNPATVPAGSAPATIVKLTAQARTDGVVVSFPGTSERAEGATTIRLHRRLLTPQAKAEKSGSALMSTPAEPAVRDLLVEIPAGQPLQTLDASAQFGMTYEYTAQRVRKLTVSGKSIELAGEPSPPVKIFVEDTFPPAVPSGLAAVAVPDEKSIDLSWQPDTEADLAGYIVYRIQVGEAENGNGEADWIRISGSQPVPSPAYRDPSVQPGRSYRYAVSAIDQTGHESKRSAEAQESIPNQ
jgi:hypothetical protein